MVASGSRTMIAGSLSSCIAGFHQSCRFSQSSGPRRSCVGIGPGFVATGANLSESVVVKEVEAAARPLGKQIQVLEASTDAEIDAAFSTLAQLRAGALVIVADQFYNDRRERIAALALRHALPSVYARREY
jgi:hypothetical protein